MSGLTFNFGTLVTRADLAEQGRSFRTIEGPPVNGTPALYTHSPLSLDGTRSR
jgi:hypothetical protein